MPDDARLRAAPRPEEVETLIVGEVMNAFPETVPVFIDRRMACPGCVMAPFMTVREAALEYAQDPAEFAAVLAAVIGGEPA